MRIRYKRKRENRNRGTARVDLKSFLAVGEDIQFVQKQWRWRCDSGSKMGVGGAKMKRFAIPSKSGTLTSVSIQ
jgi:hypothetical protein